MNAIIYFSRLHNAIPLFRVITLSVPKNARLNLKHSVCKYFFPCYTIQTIGSFSRELQNFVIAQDVTYFRILGDTLRCQLTKKFREVRRHDNNCNKTMAFRNTRLYNYSLLLEAR